MKPRIVFIHGWGTNSAIWGQVSDVLQEQAEVHLLDLPGYGQAINQIPTDQLQQTSRKLLDAAPEDAVWVGWSLGGMVAMQAVLLDSDNKKIKALQLLCSTPKFVGSEDWSHGMALDVFKKFANDVVVDYRVALRSFLLLQAGGLGTAREVAKKASAAMSVYSEPSEQVLTKGIEYLRDIDLREQISAIDIPVQVLAGRLDCLTPYAAGEYIVRQIKSAELHILPSGHIPFLTNQHDYVQRLMAFVSSVECR